MIAHVCLPLGDAKLEALIERPARLCSGEAHAQCVRLVLIRGDSALLPERRAILTEEELELAAHGVQHGRRWEVDRHHWQLQLVERPYAVSVDAMAGKWPKGDVGLLGMGDAE